MAPNELFSLRNQIAAEMSELVRAESRLEAELAATASRNAETNQDVLLRLKDELRHVRDAKERASSQVAGIDESLFGPS